MQTFNQLKSELLEKINTDNYTRQTQLSEYELNKMTKLFYLLGKIEGVQFGSSWNETSTKPEDEIKSLTTLFEYIKNNEEL
jgi:hypothetical protein